MRWLKLRRLRREYAAVKAANDRVFSHAYDCAAGIAQLTGCGEKTRLRFAFDTMKLNPSYAEEKRLRRQIEALA